MVVLSILFPLGGKHARSYTGIVHQAVRGQEKLFRYDILLGADLISNVSFLTAFSYRSVLFSIW
jgi:hypothetical protein